MRMKKIDFYYDGFCNDSPFRLWNSFKEKFLMVLVTGKDRNNKKTSQFQVKINMSSCQSVAFCNRHLIYFHLPNRLIINVTKS